MCLSLFEGGARDRGQIRSSPIGNGTATGSNTYRHSYLASLLFWCRGWPLCAPSPGSVGVACRRPLPWLGWGRPGRPLPLRLLVVGAPVGVPSVGGLLPSSFPPSGGPPWGCGVRTSTKRQARLLRTCLRLLGSSSYLLFVVNLL